MDNLDYYLEIDRISFFNPLERIEMIEVFLCGIVLGLIPITLAGLLVIVYLQYMESPSVEFEPMTSGKPLKYRVNNIKTSIPISLTA